MRITEEKTDSKSRFPNLKLSKRLFLTAIVASLLLIAITPILHMSLWYCILLGGTVWQRYLSPGSLPEYDGVYLRLKGNKVESLSFGFHSPIPHNYFLIVNDIPKPLIDIRPDDLTSLGMTSDPNPTFGDLSFELGTIQFLSFGEFKNGELCVLSIKHSRFKFSKTADGPFFSLPISFDEYKKMFGKPLRWRREFSGRRVP